MKYPEGFESSCLEEQLYADSEDWSGGSGTFGLPAPGAEFDDNSNKFSGCTDFPVRDESNYDGEPGGFDDGQFGGEQGILLNDEPDIDVDQLLALLSEEPSSSTICRLEEVLSQKHHAGAAGPFQEGPDIAQAPEITTCFSGERRIPMVKQWSPSLLEQGHGFPLLKNEYTEDEALQNKTIQTLSNGARSKKATDYLPSVQPMEQIDYDRPRMSNDSVLASDCLSATSPMASYTYLFGMHKDSYPDGEVVAGSSGALELSTLTTLSRGHRNSNARAADECIEIVSSSDGETSTDIDDADLVIDDKDCETSKLHGKRKLLNWARPEKEDQRRRFSASASHKSLSATQPGKLANHYLKAPTAEEKQLPSGYGEPSFPGKKLISYTQGGRRILPPTISVGAVGACSGQMPLSIRPMSFLNGASLNLPNEDDATLRTMLQEMASGDGKEEALVAENLMTVPLLKHQRIGLAWMEKRERRLECAGGILADDQGLGKTVSTIALILKVRAPVQKNDLSSGQLVEYNASAVDLVDDDRDISGDGGDDDDIGDDADVECLPLNSTGQESIKSSISLPPISVNLVGKAQHAEKPHRKSKNLSWKGRPAAGTLIVCPTSVLRQWDHEIREKVTEAADLSVLIYHGPSRTKDPDEIARYDVVLTTYAIVAMEVPKQPLPDEKNEDKRNVDDCGLVCFRNSLEVPRRVANSKSLRKSPQNGKKTKRSSKTRNVDEESPSLIVADMGPLAGVAWFRVVLDEAQSIKNCRTKVARACWSLRAKRRWCLSGTPIQNTIDDLYSYFRFLRHDPLDEYKSFRSQIKEPISRNPAIGYKKLQLILQTLMLRRTKATIIDGEPIVQLPPRIVSLKQIDFTVEERSFYNKLEVESRQKFQVYAAEGSLQKNYVNILWMLLRLRQACNHPLLVKAQNVETLQVAAIGSAGHLTVERRFALQNPLEGNNMICPICMDPPEEPVVSTCTHVFCRQCISEKLTNEYEFSCPDIRCQKTLNNTSIHSLASLQDLSADSDIYSRVPRGRPNSDLARENSTWTTSSKIDAVMKTLTELPIADNFVSKTSEDFSDHEEKPSTHLVSKPLGDIQTVPPKERQMLRSTEKAIVFSQWTSMLDLLEKPLKRSDLSYRRLDGTMTVVERDRAVLDFNTLPEVTVMIMSLKAASLGLNMIAACHVLLLDVWWNPTTEDQAIDRAHRIGQTRPVRVSRFTIKGTIEDRILALQERKRQLVASAFGENQGVNEKTRLTVEDLRYLFSI